MSAFVGEVRLFALPFAPSGWIPCDGALYLVEFLPALGRLLGNRFGGDGATQFAVPDLRGRVPIGAGPFPGVGSPYSVGQSGGAETVALGWNQIPQHTHALNISTATGTKQAPQQPGGEMYYPAQPGAFKRGTTTVTPNLFVPSAPASSLVELAPASVAASGANQEHNNMQPSITLMFCIASGGIYPTQA